MINIISFLIIKLFQISSFLILIIRTFISISASSWVGAWVGLEINLLSIMPILILTKNIKSSEASIKYFITQIIASIVLLAFILLIIINFPNSFYGNPPPYLGIIGALILKIGAAPLHFWLPSVIEGLTWPRCIIIITWQKITPMILLSFISKFNIFILIFIVMSSLIGAIGGFNQTNLKKIMAFSSINHISWIIIAITLNEITWIVYFLSYCLISLSIVILFIIQGNSQINQLWNSINKSFFSKNCNLCLSSFLRGLTPIFRVFTKMNYYFKIN